MKGANLASGIASGEREMECGKRAAARQKTESAEGSLFALWVSNCGLFSHHGSSSVQKALLFGQGKQHTATWSAVALVQSNIGCTLGAVVAAGLLFSVPFSICGNIT